MHVIHLNLLKRKHLVLFVSPLFVIGMSTYIPYVIIKYVKEEIVFTTDSACSRNLLLKKTNIDINIYIYSCKTREKK